MSKEELKNSNIKYIALSCLVFFTIGYATVKILQLYFVGSDTAQFWITTCSFGISIGIYLITQKQSNVIEANTKALVETQQELLDINTRLDDELMGHTDDFHKLMEKVIKTLEEISGLPHNGQSIRIIFPVLSLGLINKDTKGLYKQLRKSLKKIILSDKKVDFFILNPLSGKFTDRTNPVSDFLKAIMESSIAKQNNEAYETNYKTIISDYLTSITDILSFIYESEDSENNNIHTLESILQGSVCFSGINECRTLTFYIGTDTIQEIDKNNEMNQDIKEKFISTGYFSKTKESNILTNCFINIQSQKFNVENLFKTVSLPDLYWLLKYLEKKINAIEIDSNIDSTIDSYIQKATERKYKYEKIGNNNIELYTFNNGNANKTILFIPSAAGIYSVFSENGNEERYRLDLYQDLCLDISQKCNAKVTLCSFSGMGIITKNEKSLVFSLEQGVKDLKSIIDYVNKKNEVIIGIWGICVGAQIALEHRNLTHCNIPLFAWSMPVEVGWNNQGTLNACRRMYKSVNFQERIIGTINEPRDSIANCDFENWEMFYAHVPNDKIDPSIIKNTVNKGSNITFKEFINLGHIPIRIQNESAYTDLLEETNNFFYKCYPSQV